MLFRRFTLFRFFGFQIKADLSWLFLSVLIFWTMASNVYPRLWPGQGVEAYQFMALLTLGGIFLSIIMHEVAHAIVAEYYHMPIVSITLFIFGGVAEMRGDPSHPRGEFLMALAGPAMSALLGLLSHAAAQLYGGWYGQDGVPVALEYLGQLNFLIAAFNLLPAFPLDGGRALRAVIWRWKNNFVLATRIASDTGYVLAYALLGLACYQIAFGNSVVSGIWSGITGLFIHGAAAHAVRQTESRSLLSAEPAGRFTQENVVSVSPDITITELVDSHVYRHYQKSFPVVDRGMLAGVIFLSDVLSLDRGRWPWLHVASVMQPPSETTVIAPDLSAAEALDIMQRHGRDSLVVAEGGKLLGVITFRDLASYLAITMKFDRDRPVERGKTAY